MGIFVCLYLFMNFVLEGTLKTNFPGTSLANCAAVPLASLDSANFFDNLKTPLLFTLGNPAYAVEKKMATHSRTLAWRTAWTEEAGGL